MKPLIPFLFALIQFYPVYSGKINPGDSFSGDTLKVLTWNVYLLPSMIYPKTFKKARAHEIVKLPGTNFSK